MDLTKDQQAFLQQRSQQQLVQWCDRLMMSGGCKSLIHLNSSDPYVRYAADRKSPWIREKEPGHFAILGSGWKAASTFLKR